MSHTSEDTEAYINLFFFFISFKLLGSLHPHHIPLKEASLEQMGSFIASFQRTLPSSFFFI